ncbi:MAG TPA: hypothetical protein VFM25_09990, partial [Verrucomicrobiae bacterium]|nr:hypothetical protein [Verrucomicrobiae bacterium]
ELQRVEVAPKDEEFLLYPDFLVNLLIKFGIGVIEASRSKNDSDRIDFIFTSHRTGESQIVASIGSGFFRPLLARLGPRFGAENMLYLGHTFFTCEAECEGRKRSHGFSLFVCNEPTMGIWMKLYFYSIDGVWPMRKEAE